MSYRRLPYALRYLIALLAWACIVSADLLARFLLLAFLPVLWIRSAFGLAHTQETAQMSVDYVDFYTRPLMRMPLLRRRRRPPNCRPKAIK